MYTTNRLGRPTASREGHPRRIVSDRHAAQEPLGQDVNRPIRPDATGAVRRCPAASRQSRMATSTGSIARNGLPTAFASGGIGERRHRVDDLAEVHRKASQRRPSKHEPLQALLTSCDTRPRDTPSTAAVSLIDSPAARSSVASSRASRAASRRACSTACACSRR